MRKILRMGLGFWLTIAPTALADSTSATCASDWHACKDNGDMVNNFTGWADIQAACQTAVDNQNQYGDPKWPGFFSGGAFGSYRPGDDYVSSGIAVAIEPDVQIQNEYGAMAHSTATCDYDLNAKKVLDVSVTPNQ